MAGWWEEKPPQEKKRHTGAIAAGSVGGAAGLAAGAYLLTRGKAKPKAMKIAPTFIKPKTPAPRPPKPAPQKAQINVNRITLTPRQKPKITVNRASMENAQRVQQGKQVKLERKEANEVAPKRWQDDPNLKGIPENASMEEVDRLLDAPGRVPGPVPQKPSARAKRKAAGKKGPNGTLIDPDISKADQRILAERAAFEIMEEIHKATLTGEKGDKRNTKYALAGLAGYTVGVNAGARIGPRFEGTTWRKNRNKVISRMETYANKEKAKITARNAANQRKSFRPKGKPPVDPNTWQPSLREVNRINNSVKGTRGIVAGSITGAVLGTAGATALYAAHRNKKRNQVVQ